MCETPHISQLEWNQSSIKKGPSSTPSSTSREKVLEHIGQYSNNPVIYNNLTLRGVNLLRNEYLYFWYYKWILLVVLMYLFTCVIFSKQTSYDVQALSKCTLLFHLQLSYTQHFFYTPNVLCLCLRMGLFPPGCGLLYDLLQAGVVFFILLARGALLNTFSHFVSLILYFLWSLKALVSLYTKQQYSSLKLNLSLAGWFIEARPSVYTMTAVLNLPWELFWC